MRLSVEWIKELAPVDVGAEEIAHTLTMAGLEVEETEESAIGPVLNVKVTPNRGDCLSVLGVARELAATYGVSIQRPKIDQSDEAGEASNITSVAIESPDLCPRYAARILRSVQAKKSPQWMQDRLTAAGMRPISGIVDVTNYVMLELGQPLHAFDLDKLAERRIVVRRARPGETLRTLDGTDRPLTTEMLMICDAKAPVAVAGVMGGGPTEYGFRTQNVLLESAHFDPLSIRRTSRALNLRTEASMRFERVVDPDLVVRAADRACTLIQDLGMGDVVPGVVDVYPSPQPERALEVRTRRVSLLLGFEVTDAEVLGALTRLGFETLAVTPTHPNTPTQTFRVPTWRPDIVREVDLVEEVGRVLGYERIPEQLPHGASTQGMRSAESVFVERVRAILSGAGLQEIVSHSLLAPSKFEDPRDGERRIAIRSALSTELSGLRRSLLPGLMDAMERNARRGQSPLAFFEIGHVFHAHEESYRETPWVAGAMAGPIDEPFWQTHGKSDVADFSMARGFVERILAGMHVTGVRFEESFDPRLHPGRRANALAGEDRLGYVGELHPDLLTGLTVRTRVVVFALNMGMLETLATQGARFVPLTAYPGVVRDLAPRIASEIPYENVEAAVLSVKESILEGFTLTDLFAGPPLPQGVKSLTLSLAFRAPDHTLTDEEVNQSLARIRAALEASCGATFAA